VRKILAVLIGTAAGLAFGSCPTPDYGVPSRSISGMVKGENEEVVPGIKVSIINNDRCKGRAGYTGEYGQFFIDVCKNTHTVLFEDVDGPLNGEYKNQTVTGVQNGRFLEITLEPK